MRALKKQREKQKGQTVLEYILVLAVVILPVAIAIRDSLSDSDDGKRKNMVTQIVDDAYGDDKRMGVIGRPYP